MEEVSGELGQFNPEQKKQFIYHHPVWGDKLEGDGLEEAYSKRNEAWEDESFLPVSIYRQSTVERFEAEHPQVALVLHLPFDADLKRVAFSLPVDPYTLAGETDDGWIVASGLADDRILYEDMPERFDDDAIRAVYQHGTPASYYEKYDQTFVEKIQTLSKEHPERIAATVSNVFSPVLKALPIAAQVSILFPALFPISVARGASNIRSVMYKNTDHIADFIPFFDNPERAAKLQRALKPYFEKTFTRELEIALSSLKARDSLEALRKLGVQTDVEVVPFADRRYASAEYIWDEEPEQVATVTKAIHSVIDIYQELASLQGIEPTKEDLDELHASTVRELASMRIHRVKRGPGATTTSALRHRIEQLPIQESKSVTAVIDKVWKTILTPVM